ncbi:hypothetical protein LTR04_002283 [Oleoguttula sp. CCFEE 6159]|nr:hypothetical protein LTR04_002283 [Oleoguttula sp. CCFEE 6159]
MPTRALVHLGANAFIVGRNVEKVERMAKDIATSRNGARVIGIGSIDVRNPASLQTAINKCVSDLGAIDFVIAGAAGNFIAPIRALSTNAFKSVIDIDVLGSYNTAKLTLPHLIKSAAKSKSQRRSGLCATGRIIFVGASFPMTGMALQTHASVAKAGINALSGNIAIEMGPLGVTSNVVVPGGIEGTEGMDRLSVADETESSISLIPLGKLGTVKDIADATVYLFSDAGSYVNGDILTVDGGAWRTSGGMLGRAMKYPDFFLSDEDVKAARKGAKAKL